MTPFGTKEFTPLAKTGVVPLKRRTKCVEQCQVKPAIPSLPSKRQGSSEVTVPLWAWIVPSQRIGSTSVTPSRIRTLNGFWELAVSAVNAKNSDSRKDESFIEGSSVTLLVSADVCYDNSAATARW